MTKDSDAMAGSPDVLAFAALPRRQHLAVLPMAFAFFANR
jgi:hypothetical protein